MTLIQEETALLKIRMKFKGNARYAKMYFCIT
jgi:hypothetical protein